MRGRHHNQKGGFVARKKGHARRGSSLMSTLKPVLYGTIAGLITPRIPYLNTMAYGNYLAGAVAGYFGKRTLMGAGLGAVGGGIVAPPVGSAINQMTGSRIY